MQFSLTFIAAVAGLLVSQVNTMPMLNVENNHLTPHQEGGSHLSHHHQASHHIASSSHSQEDVTRGVEGHHDSNEEPSEQVKPVNPRLLALGSFVKGIDEFHKEKPKSKEELLSEIRAKAILAQEKEAARLKALAQQQKKPLSIFGPSSERVKVIPVEEKQKRIERALSAKKITVD